MARQQDRPVVIADLTDPVAEKALVGAMLSSPEARAIALEIVSIENFAQPEHRAVFSAVASLMSAGQPIDLVTVRNQLKHEPLALELNVDWLKYLTDLQADVMWSRRNAESYARIVVEKAEARHASAAGVEFQQALRAGISPNVALESMFEALNRAPSSHLIGMGELVSQASDLFQAGRPTNTVSTGLPELDEYIHGGFLPKNLVIIGARPSVGKSAIALSIAIHAAEQGVKVLFVSGEMSGIELAMRMVARYSGIPASTSMNSTGPGSYSAVEIKKFHEALSKMSALPFKLVDGATTIAAIRARCQAEAMTGHPVGLVIVDYLQIMLPGERRGDNTRQNEVSELARGLKNLAMDLDLTVIALSQLGRALESRQDKRPQLADLRESGELEQAADTVLGLYRSEIYDPTTIEVGIMEILILKQRSGRAGITVKAAWNGERTAVFPLAHGYGHATVTRGSASPTAVPDEGPAEDADEEDFGPGLDEY
jgi:replicative DNA helicase